MSTLKYKKVNYVIIISSIIFNKLGDTIVMCITLVLLKRVHGLSHHLNIMSFILVQPNVENTIFTSERFFELSYPDLDERKTLQAQSQN